MKKSIQSKVMSSAWRLFRALSFKTFRQCLVMAWEIQREIKNENSFITAKQFNNIVQRLQLVQVKGTKNWFQILTSRENKRRQDPEVKEMVNEGFVPLFDLYRKQRLISASYHFTKQKRKESRPRIVKSGCTKVSIHEYLELCTEKEI